MAKAIFVPRNDVNNLLDVTGACSNNPERDSALLAVAFATSMKVIELSRFTVADVLTEKGDYRKDSIVRAEIAFNGKDRPASWLSKKLQPYIDRYFETRLKLGHGVTTNRAAYRGLDPESPVIMTDEGQPLPIDRRKTGTGKISLTCTSLSRLISRRMRESGIEGGTAESTRRTFAISLQRKGYSVTIIHRLLGNAGLKTTRRLLDSDPEDLGSIAAKAF